MKKLSVILGVILLYFIVAAFARTAPLVEFGYPKDFRTWKHVKTTIVNKPGAENEKYNGFHHIYANELAMTGYRTGKFADGSVIVFEVVTVEKEKDDIKEGKRKFVDVMFKDSKQFASTGGWEYKEFLVEDVSVDVLKETQKTSCFKCHESRQENNFVFSKLRY